MPIGEGGKYDAEATLVRSITGGKAVFLMVVDGRRGNGFAVQTTSETFVPAIIKTLRDTANQLERDLQTVKASS